MKVVIAGSEAVPFAKTGGLADVVGSLPKALFRLGHEPILVMPLYASIRREFAALNEAATIEVPIGVRRIPARVWQTTLPGAEATAYFVENDAYFDRDGVYGENGEYPDNCARFAFFSRAAIETVRAIGFVPDVFHLHDWPAALIAPYLKTLYANDPVVGGAGTLLTIHNMAHQGIFPSTEMETIGIDWKYFNWKEFEFWGKINLLKAGIVFSDEINTVSPAYAREIQTAEFGHGLEGVLHDREAVVHGVVNGIDSAVWDPAADPLIPATFGPEDLQGKATCKRSLQRQCGLPLRKTPLVGIVSRLAAQKGLDIAADALETILDESSLQCIILGNGGNGICARLERLVEARPEHVRLFVRHDEKLAHRIMAGSDMVLVPSRFEPCGLTQLYGLKYGSVPVVRATGGLMDTVRDCTPETLADGTAGGFVFEESSPAALAACMRRAMELYRDAKSWRRLIQIGMAQDWSWEVSAQRYVELYRDAKEKRRAE